MPEIPPDGVANPTPPDSFPFYAGRIKELMRGYHADINAQVQDALDDLHARWNAPRAALNVTIARLEREMQQALDAGDTITYAWLAQADRLARLKADVAGDVQQFADGARQLVGDAQQDAIGAGQAAAQEALAATVPPGMQMIFGVPPSDVTDELAGALQPGSPLASLFDAFGADAAQLAQQALFTSVALGEGAKDAASRLEWATNMSAQRAEVIARTEIARSWRGAQMANYRANSDVVQQWMWAADQGPRCCSACLAMDGTYHSLDEELSDHVCGRCSALPITVPWSQILGDAGLSPDVINGLNLTETSLGAQGRESAADWLAKQSPEMQNSIMGPAKAEAWRQGALELRDLVEYRYSPQWGWSLGESSMTDLGLDPQRYLTDWRSGSTATRAGAELSASLDRAAASLDLAEAKRAADAWYREIEDSIAFGVGAQSPAALAEAKAAADAWYAEIEQSIARGIAPASSAEAFETGSGSLWDIRREEAIAVAEGRAEFLSAKPAASEAEGFALKEPPTASTAQAALTREALSGKSMPELRQMAQDLGVQPARSKAETIDRLLAQQAKTTQAPGQVKPETPPAKAANAAPPDKLVALRSQLADHQAERELLYGQQHDLVAEQDKLLNIQRNPKNILARAEYRARIELYHATLDRSNPEVRKYFKNLEAYQKAEGAQKEMARLQEVMDRLLTQGKQNSAEFAQVKADYAALEKADSYANQQKLYQKLWSQGIGVYKPELDSMANFETKYGHLFTPEQIANSRAVKEARGLIANLDTRIAAVNAQIAAVDKDIAAANKQIKRDLAQLEKAQKAARLSDTAASVTFDTMRPFSDVIELPEGHQAPNALMQKMDYKMREPRAVTKRRIIDDINKRLKNNPDWQEYVARAAEPQLGAVYHWYIGEYATAADTKSAQLVADWIKKWGVGYRPGSPEWVAMQMAVREEFGLDAAIHTAAANAPGGERYYAENGAAVRALMRAMYDNTQQWFAENGITEIEVYRGFGWAEAQQELVPQGITWGPMERPNYGVADLELNPFQSFSADINVSQGTGAGNGFAGGGFGGGSDYSLLVGAKVPVDRVLGTAQTGFGAKLESEIVVMGRATDSVSYRAGTKVEDALLQQAEEQPISPRETLYSAPDGTVVHVMANADGTYTATLQAGMPLTTSYANNKLSGVNLKVGKSKTYKTVASVNKLLRGARISNTYVAPDLEGLAVREGEDLAASTASATVTDGMQAQLAQLPTDATVADAQDWLKSQLSEHASVDLMALDAPAARLVGNALGNLLPELPEVAGALERVAVQATRDGALAYVTPDGSALVLNAEKWGDAAALASLAERAPTYAASGWWVAQTPEQALGHELGHLLQLNYHIPNDTWAAALERVAAAGENPLVSQYAGDKLEESFAETFALLVYGQPSEAQLPITREMATLLRANGLDYTTLRAAVGSVPLDLA